MLSRLVAEIVRLLVTTLVILGIGMILGFRFHHGAAAAVLWVAIPVIFGVAFAALATAIALSWPKSVMVEALQPVIILGANFCTGFIPVDLYPDWVQPARPADGPGRRCDARAIRRGAGGVAADEHIAVVCGNLRGMPGADHCGLSQGEHQSVVAAMSKGR
jgi:daunorubicin resistance protein C